MYLLAMLTKILILSLSLIALIVYEPSEFVLFGKPDEETTLFNEFTWIGGLFILCIILPFFESIIGQAIPIWLLSKVTNNRLIYVIFSSIWFTYLHSIIGKGIAFALTIFFAGVIYAWCFIIYKEKGFWKGILIATCVHFLYNFTVFITFYIL